MSKSPKKLTGSPARILAKSISASAVPTYLLDAHGRLLFANLALSRLLGIPVDQLIGLDCSSPISPDAHYPPNPPNITGASHAAPSSGSTASHAPASKPAGTTGSFPVTGVEDTKPSLPDLFKIASLLAPSPLQVPHRASRDGIEVPSRPSESRVPSSEWIERVTIPLESSGRSSLLCILQTQSTPSLRTPSTLNEDDRIHRTLVSIRNRYATLDGLTCLMGTSGLAKRSLNQTQAAIASQSSVCITGPEGSGKREVASAIFQGRLKKSGASESSDQLFPVECRLMDSGLLSNLFEVVEGNAIHGSKTRRQTLLLDRLDLLPQDAHPVLLQFLNRNRVSSVIATTLRPLVECHLRQSTWAEIVGQIDIQTVALSPLSLRPEDIPIVIQGLFHQFRQAKRIEIIPAIQADAMELLQAYSWPKNFIELRSVLQELCDGASTKIEASRLPISIRTFASFVETDPNAMEPIDLDGLLLDVEKTIILGVLEKFPNNRALAARHLGISRTRLLRRLEQLSLEEETESPISKRTERTTTRSKASSVESLKTKEVATAESVVEPASESKIEPHLEDVIEFTEIEFQESDEDV